MNFMNRKGIIISVFAGLGKTTVGDKYSNVCDLQSSPYRCDYSNIKPEDYDKMKCDNSRVPNPNWPQNYLDAVKESVEKYDIVLVPSSLDIRNLLANNNIDFTFIMPSIDSKDKLLDIYNLRNNNKELIKQCNEAFDNWSRDQKDYNYKIEILSSKQFLEDFLIENNLL